MLAYHSFSSNSSFQDIRAVRIVFNITLHLFFPNSSSSYSANGPAKQEKQWTPNSSPSYFANSPTRQEKQWTPNSSPSYSANGPANQEKQWTPNNSPSYSANAPINQEKQWTSNSSPSHSANAPTNEEKQLISPKQLALILCQRRTAHPHTLPTPRPNKKSSGCISLVLPSCSLSLKLSAFL